MRKAIVYGKRGHARTKGISFIKIQSVLGSYVPLDGVLMMPMDVQCSKNEVWMVSKISRGQNLR